LSGWGVFFSTRENIGGRGEEGGKGRAREDQRSVARRGHKNAKLEPGPPFKEKRKKGEGRQLEFG